MLSCSCPSGGPQGPLCAIRQLVLHPATSAANRRRPPAACGRNGQGDEDHSVYVRRETLYVEGAIHPPQEATGENPCSRHRVGTPEDPGRESARSVGLRSGSPWCQLLPVLLDKPGQPFVPPLRGDRFRANPPVRQFGLATRRESRYAPGSQLPHRSQSANTSPTTVRENLAVLGLWASTVSCDGAG